MLPGSWGTEAYWSIGACGGCVCIPLNKYKFVEWTKACEDDSSTYKKATGKMDGGPILISMLASRNISSCPDNSTHFGLVVELTQQPRYISILHFVKQLKEFPRGVENAPLQAICCVFSCKDKSVCWPWQLQPLVMAGPSSQFYDLIALTWAEGPRSGHGRQITGEGSFCHAQLESFL